ncbi:hypothetical protein [Corynebacterium sp. HMSC076D02]|uniref:hypothetical protein n=1 Tax=Corynebacterium sp. HMSC076D02 TaxID=1739439 RepID=UPI0008A172CD|nr:hypothetical protein [Corynebacterium sp. HMSC076D02]OFQ48116.1 hypothetical protein HMPREF2935_00825 [Corynebacterium sp. HMSC076D02]
MRQLTITYDNEGQVVDIDTTLDFDLTQIPTIGSSLIAAFLAMLIKNGASPTEAKQYIRGLSAATGRVIDNYLKENPCHQ